jgi:hypothetical protein
MDKKLIDLIVKYISKKYHIHTEICYKDEYRYIDDLYFSSNGIRVGGLDICTYITDKYGLTSDEGKVIIKEWINIGLKITESDYDFEKLWFNTYISGNILNCSGYTGTFTNLIYNG